MIRNIYILLLLSLSYGIDDFNLIKSEEPFPLSEGKIVFHSYSDYEAWDGKLFLYDFSEQLLTEISQGWDIDHTINAHFSPDGSKIVFMGAPAGNHNSSSWDIYLWDLFSGLPINLTANNGLRDEDPKFSPNGNEIVFKQDGDLKVMDLNNNTIIHTTNNGYSIEESMPYYTSDSQYIIYARGAGISSDIYLINKDGMENQPLENITNIQEYYPIIRSNSTFLYTRWVSAANHHDQIYLGYFSDTNAQSLSFNDESADDSDPFPVNSEYVLFSSNRSGGQGGWDLYLADINSSTTWSMDEFNLNSSIHELGICYFSGVSINGCTDSSACNYDEDATEDDGSCEYEVDCAGDCGGELEPDCCGVCGGDNSQCSNCCGSPFYEDCTDDCSIDINEECCYELEVDACGVCNGDGSTCSGSAHLEIQNVNLSEGTLDIYMINTITIAGFQFYLPGLELTGASGGSAEEAGFYIMQNETMTVGFDMNALNTIPSGEGVLISISFSEYELPICMPFQDGCEYGYSETDCPLDLYYWGSEGGIYNAGDNNPILANISGNNITTTTGDCYENDDNWIYGCTYDTATNYNAEATFDDGSCDFLWGDMNHDGTLNVQDVIFLVNAILSGDWF